MNQNPLISMFLNQLRNRNPSAFNEVMSMMNSGSDPRSILTSLLNSGRFTQQQVEEAKNIAQQYSQNQRRF